MLEGLIVLPLTGALAAFLLRGQAARLGVATVAATALLTLAVAAAALQQGVLQAALGGWSPPLGIRLRADGLAVLLLAMNATVGLALSLFAAGYFADPREHTQATPLFWPLWLLLWGTLNGVFLAADLFTVYVLLEVGLLAAVALATLAGSRTATVAALRYLLAAMGGSLCYLLGVAILYDQHATLDLVLLAEGLQPGRGASAALVLMTLGLMLKAALFPLHFWLPPAHAAAPAPVSAILSALVVKAGFYILLRLWLALAPATLPPGAGQALGALAAAAILWGSLQALRQRRLKMLIAYSTVAQVGFLFLAFPLLLAAAEAAAAGALHATAHALAKAALFLAAGVVMLARGGDTLSGMRGLAWQQPVTVLALLLAGLALYGPGGSGTALAKELLTDASEASGQWWWPPLLEIGGLLTLAYVAAMLRYTVYPRDPQTATHAVPLGLQALPLLLAAAALAVGWLQPQLLTLLALGGEGGSA